MKRISIVFGVVIILIAVLAFCDSDIFDQSVADENIEDENIELSDEPIVGMNTVDTSYRLKYCDGALYFLVGSSYRTNSPLETFWRYNVRTGNLTAVCGDPVCQHADKACPFYAMDSRFAIYQGNIVYDRIFFLKHDQKNGNSYFENVCFNMNTQKVTQLSETEGMIQSAHVTELYSDHYRFFYTWAENEDTKEYFFRCAG